MYSCDELFRRSLLYYVGVYSPRCFATLQINTKISLSWALKQFVTRVHTFPDNKVHGANMGSTWVLSAPEGPHVGPMNLAIRDYSLFTAAKSGIMKHNQYQRKQTSLILLWKDNLPNWCMGHIQSERQTQSFSNRLRITTIKRYNYDQMLLALS